MLLIEGPRASGKTTLTTALSFQLELPVYDYSEQLRIRGSYDVKETIVDIQKWRDKPFGIYQGHPFIEEYIYGPILRREVAPDFYSWEIRPAIQFIWANSVIVYCRPTNYSGEDGALPFYDLLFRTPLLPIQVWEYDFRNEYDLDKIITSIGAYRHALGVPRVNGTGKRWYQRT